MSGLLIDREACQSCGLCVGSCAVQALRMDQELAAVDAERCTLCGMCVDTCPFDAIRIEKRQTERDTAAYRGLWVWIEQRENQPLGVGYELLGKGRELADARGAELTALLFGGSGIAQAAPGLIAAGADRVLVAEDAAFASRQEEAYCDLLARLSEQRRPEIILFGATSFGRSLAPRLAARLKTGLTADCTGLSINAESGLLEQTRPAFGGNLMATILCPAHRPQMATVRPGVMPPPLPDWTRQGATERIETAGLALKPLLTLLREEQLKTESIADAEIVVSAGRGIGQAKNLVYIRELAELLGGALGCSRPLVDTGWCEYKHQVGQTGCSIAPRLLITCGISGAIQHLAGIANARTIVAINSDPEAPIFSLADYKVVGDCMEVVKALIAALKAE